LALAVPSRPDFPLQFLVQHVLDPQTPGKVLQQHRAYVASELFLAKAEVALAHFSDYLLAVHLLGASFALR
jgi:hypothetical protein